MNKIESVRKLNARELELGIAGTTASWHQQYARSPVVYIGGLQANITPIKLVEVFEQYGVVNHVHLKRDEKTGNIRGFGFLAYADARSAVLAVDNLNGFDLDGRLLSVDHVQDYKYPVDALGASTEFTMRPEQGPVIENTETSTAMAAVVVGSTNRGSIENSEEILKKREETVMGRLKEFQKRRAEEERIAKKNENAPQKMTGKRPRNEVVPGGERENREMHDEVDNDVYDSSKTSRRGKKEKEAPGAKEARRLERAAIREERRRRRAKRLARGGSEEASTQLK